MHYNIALLHKKVTDCVKVMHYVTCAFLFVTRAEIAYLFFNNKKPKSYIFGNCKVPLTPKVKWMSLSLKEVPLHLTPDFSQHGERRAVSE